MAGFFGTEQQMALQAVAEDAREWTMNTPGACDSGRFLGKYVNAKMVSDCFSRLDAESIHELVAASNTPSRKMVEASGLRLDPTVKCGIAMSGGEGRFTK